MIWRELWQLLYVAQLELAEDYCFLIGLFDEVGCVESPFTSVDRAAWLQNAESTGTCGLPRLSLTLRTRVLPRFRGRFQRGHNDHVDHAKVRVLRATLFVLLMLANLTCNSLFASGTIGPKQYSGDEQLVVVQDENGSALDDAAVHLTWGLRDKYGFMYTWIHVFEGVTDSEGKLLVPAWGPVGVANGDYIPITDPFLRVFKEGYLPLILTNIGGAGFSGGYRSPGKVRIMPAERPLTLVASVEGRDKYLQRLRGLAGTFRHMQSSTCCFAKHGDLMVRRVNAELYLLDPTDSDSQIYVNRAACN